MKQRVLLTDFSLGMVSRKVMGRLDVSLQQHSVEHLEGFAVAPDGGATRRRGTTLIREDLGIDPVDGGLFQPRSVPGVLVIRRGEANQARPWALWIDRDKMLRALNLDTGEEVEVVNAAGSEGEPITSTGAFYAKPETNVEDQAIQLWTDTTAWRIHIHNWSAEFIDKDELGTVFQNRLILADRRWGDIHMSVPLDLFRFDIWEEVEIPDSDPPATEEIPTGAIQMIPDHYGEERVTWLLSRQSVYMGTDAGEYEITSSLPFFANDPGGAQIFRVSSIGSEGACYFGSFLVLRKQDRLIRMAWSEGHRYATEGLTDYLDNGKIVQHLGIEYGGHRYLVMLDIHRDLYCFTEVPGKEIGGWSLLSRGVWWVAEYDKDLYIVRENGAGGFRLEVLPLDSLAVPGTRSPWQDDAFLATAPRGDGTAYLVVSPDGTTGDRLPAGATVQAFLVNGHRLIYARDFDVDGNGEINAPHTEVRDAAGQTGAIPAPLVCVPREASSPGVIRTLPIHIPSALGTALGDLKRVTALVVVVHESAAFQARSIGGPWEAWDSGGDLYTGPVRLRLESFSGEVAQAEIETIGDAPLTVMSIEAEVEVENV